MARFREKLAHCGHCGVSDLAMPSAQPSTWSENDLISAHAVLDEWKSDAVKDDNSEAVAAFTLAMELIDEKLDTMAGPKM